MSRVLPPSGEAVVIPPRPKFSKAVRERVFARERGVCSICKEHILAGEDWDLEHDNQRAISGDDSERNLFPAHRNRPECHPKKTAEDAAVRAHVNRMAFKHRTPKAEWPRRGPQLKGRGFGSGRWSDIEKKP